MKLKKLTTHRELGHFVVLTRKGEEVYLIPSKVTRIRPNHNPNEKTDRTLIRDVVGELGVSESVGEVLRVLNLPVVTFHRGGRDVHFVAPHISRIRAVPVPTETERTEIIDTSGPQRVSEDLHTVLGIVDAALTELFGDLLSGEGADG